GGYTFQWILSYPYEEIANNITLPITIHYINGMKGEWNFDIPIKQEKGKTVVVNHLESYPNEGVSIKIKDIMIAEVSSTLEFETVSEYKQDQINFEKALDEKGNVLLHGGNKSLISRTEEKDGYRSTLRKTTSKIDEDVQSITFYPSLAIVEAPAQQLLNSSTFTLKSARSNLKIKVNSITEEDSKVTVDYQLQGFDGDRSDILKHNLAYAFTLVDNDYVDKIDPENPYPPEGHSIAKNEVKLLDKKTGHYQSVFYLNGEEKIEDFSLQNTVLQFDFNGFIRTKELAPFTVQLSK
ncbi:MAG: hypothetical protein RR595_05090, partial [Lysinibacillus sp.]